MAELDGFFKWKEEQGGLVGLRGVVKQFAEALIEAGVNIPPPLAGIPEKSNARILKKEAVSVGALIHEYNPSEDEGHPFWGITKSQVDQMRKEYPSNWGVVLLRGEQTGFWVHGEHFDRIAEGPYTSRNGYEQFKIHQHILEKNRLSARRFGTIPEFLQEALIV